MNIRTSEIKDNDSEEEQHSRRQTSPKQSLNNESEEVYETNTSVTESRNSKFKSICSEVVDGLIYLGSDFIAKDKSMLDSFGITHVINCSGDYSPNYHEKQGIEYKTYHLKDHISENIECIFYDAIQFIEKVKDLKGKVYIHCVQGISRSSTLVLCYLIYTQGIDYKTAFETI